MTFIWVHFWLETDIWVTLFCQLSHSHAMTTPPHANVPTSGNAPKVCPYTSLVRTPSENYYFSLTEAPESAEWSQNGQNCVTLAWELSHARAMDTIACATFLASGHTPKVCPYVSLGVTVTRNHYFSLCHSPDSAEWYYASYMHMGQKT